MAKALTKSQITASIADTVGITKKQDNSDLPIGGSVQAMNSFLLAMMEKG